MTDDSTSGTQLSKKQPSKKERTGAEKILHLVGFGFLSLLLILSIAGYIYLCPRFNPNLVNAIMFHPDPYKSPPGMRKVFAGVTGEEVTFESRPVAGEKTAPKLNGWLFRVPGANDILLISHGNAGNLHHRDWKVEAIMGSGASAFIYDYRGYGKSEGQPTLPGAVDDTISAYDYLVEKQGFKPENIILYGESIGTGFTCELARQRKCKAIVLESGFISTERLGKDKIKPLNLYPSFLFYSPILDNLDYVKGKHPPLLILAGRLDNVIPVAHSQTMYDQGAEPKQLFIFEHSGHNDLSPDLALYKKHVIDFVHNLGSQDGKARASADEQSEPQEHSEPQKHSETKANDPSQTNAVSN